ITATSVSGSNLSIQGTLNSMPNTQFTIQLFADGNDYLQPTRMPLGTANATTDSNGNANFSATVPLPPGNVTIDATATDPAGNTSEFFLRPSYFRNLSTPARIQPGGGVMIGGFIATGGYGNTAFVIRGIGPSLANSDIANPLADPVLELYDSNGALLATNDNWKDAQEAEINATGLAPTNPAESAIFALL